VNPPSSKLAVVYDDIYKQHLTGPGHPEAPERCDAVLAALENAGLGPRIERLQPTPAHEQLLRLCHGSDYIRMVEEDVGSGRSMLRTGDTDICPRSLEAAQYAAGGAAVAVDAVFAGRVQAAFCVVRPPGHHAGANFGMGFCIFNNAAIAARYAQQQHGAQRVLIVDWDVHHGNGTQDIFYNDPSVFYFSTHLWPHYPGTGSPSETGTGAARGTTLNCPFPHGTPGDRIIAAYRQKLVPAADDFKPELVVISAGFDSRRGDPLGGFGLSDDDFAELSALVLSIARRHARGRVVSLLEGGYALSGLGTAAAAHAAALCGKRGPE